VSLIAFASAKGSPGVTETVTGLAGVWPSEAVIADLDPVGGDIGLRLRRHDGAPLDHDHGLLSLGAAVRGGQMTHLDDHLQTTDGGLNALVGVTSPGQVLGLGAAWPHVGTALATAGTDVLADCGRISPGTPVAPVVERASALVFVVRSDVAALAHLRERLLWLSEPLRIGRVDGVPAGVLLVGDPRDSRSADDLERLLASAGLDVPVLGTVAHDPRTIRVVRTASARVVRRSVFVRSLADVAPRVRALATRTSTLSFEEV
jgi:hypothetical protein